MSLSKGVGKERPLVHTYKLLLGGGRCVGVSVEWVKIVSYPDPRHSSGWITSPLRGSRVWRISRQNRGHRRSNLNGTIGLRARAISDFSRDSHTLLAWCSF